MGIEGRDREREGREEKVERGRDKEGKRKEM
jgi:hypothetical protein